jgi:hypothetical protein
VRSTIWPPLPSPSIRSSESGRALLQRGGPLGVTAGGTPALRSRSRRSDEAGWRRQAKTLAHGTTAMERGRTTPSGAASRGPRVWKRRFQTISRHREEGSALTPTKRPGLVFYRFCLFRNRPSPSFPRPVRPPTSLSVGASAVIRSHRRRPSLGNAGPRSKLTPPKNQGVIP